LIFDKLEIEITLKKSFQNKLNVAKVKTASNIQSVFGEVEKQQSWLLNI